MPRGLTLTQLVAAADLVHASVPPTPSFRWPLLAERTGCELWVKHENHTPLGAFKVRGGLAYMHELRRAHPEISGVVAATRGNHGQSVTFAARRAGLRAVIVVPHGNSTEKNAAMRAQGAELIEHGHDFQAALEFATELAAREGLHAMPSFHPWLVQGVASYALELFTAVPALDTVYVPIGLGSGICGMIAARDALDLHTRIVGVVASKAAAYALSFAAGKPVATNSAETLADGLAVRVPSAEAVDIICRGAERIVTVEDEEILAAMRHYYTDSHNLAEPAGGAALAAVLKERSAVAGRRIAVVLSGANVDRELFLRALQTG